MWYRFSNLQVIDEIAQKVSQMQPYSAAEHFDLIDSYKPQLPPLPDNAGIDERVQKFIDAGEVFRAYHDIHPQIYAYPRKSTNTWWYLLFDPKDIKRMDNEDYHRKLDSEIPIEKSPLEVVDDLHKQYPTAMIDYFESEEEMLGQE